MSSPSDQTTTLITSINTQPPLSPQTMSESHTIPLQIRVRNRRKRYLEAHPSYFGSSLESADPLLYDRLIRTHQTEAERVRERSAKGFAGTLEADLLRSEAKLDEVRGRQQSSSDFTATLTSPVASRKHHVSTNGTNGNLSAASTSTLTPLPSIHNEYTTLTRDEAYQYWVERMTRRFLDGEDEDFEYSGVDGDDRWDDVRGEERDREESWFDREEEEFVGSSEDGDDSNVKTAVEGKGRRLEGETGVQDF